MGKNDEEQTAMQWKEAFVTFVAAVVAVVAFVAIGRRS